MYLTRMKKYRKIILLGACLIALIFAIFAEKHISFSMMPGNTEPKRLNALEYTEAASFDGLMRKDGNLYDIFSLTPEVLQQKDCPT